MVQRLLGHKHVWYQNAANGAEVSYFSLLTSYFSLLEPRRRRQYQQRAKDSQRSVYVFEPLRRPVRLAGLAAGAERDSRNPQSDREVGVGRRGGQRRLPADGARGL